MKTNYVHLYTPIYQIVKKAFLSSFIILAMLFSASLDIKESPSVFSYHWSMSDDEMNDFVKGGQIDAAHFTTVYYEGRNYPVYSVMLENSSSELIYKLSNTQKKILPLTALPENFSSLPDNAIDRADMSVFSQNIKFQEIPGIGTLVEIYPCLPTEDGQLSCLVEADIKLYVSGSHALQKSDLKKEKQVLAKSGGLKQNLPSEYCVFSYQESGMYQITGQDLLEKDIDISTIVPDQIKIHWWGQEIPCMVTATNNKGVESFGEDDIVRFYISEPNNPYGDYKFNPFSDFDAVVMTWEAGMGRRYIQESTVFSDDQNKFTYDMNRKFRSTIHVEENQAYLPLARLHEDELSHRYEHEFYSPSIKIGRSITYPFEIWDPVVDSPYNVGYKVRMQGLTYSVDDEMDHQIIVKVNDLQVMEDEWEGQQPRISENIGLQYSHANLNDGENNLEISVRGFSSSSYLDDQVLLDWFEISYDRYMIAHNNRLEFSPQHGAGTYMFQVRGLTSSTDIIILKNGTNWIRGYLVDEEVSDASEKTYSIYFEDECLGDETYVIVGPGKEDDNSVGIASIDSLRYVNKVDNEQFNTSPQGDYVIITHKDFYEKAKELAEHKSAIGFTPALYQIEKIYDDYNYGNESPYAIKNFIKDACENWSIDPEYVVLIGDTKTDNSIPVIHYQSTGAIGAIIAENWYADIDDDYVLDLALGRIPVSSDDEMDSVISKIKLYDSLSNPKHMNRVVTLTGTGSIFRTQAQDYLNTISPAYVQNDRLYLYNSTTTGDFDAGINSTDSLISFMNQGALCLNYIGHGSGLTWDNHVLPYEAFDQFEPNNPFIINSMTCFSNTFSNDNAIGEQFIRHPRGGVSIFGSSGYGWINSNHYLFKKLMDHMFYDNMSHGRAMQYAMTDYFFSSFGKNASFIDELDGVNYIKYFRKSLFYQFCILGDPSAAFPKLEELDSDINPRSFINGQIVDIDISNSNISHAYLDIVGTKNGDNNFPLKQKLDLDLQAGEGQFVCPDIPEGMTAGMLQFTLWDDDKNIFVAKADVSFGVPYVETLEYFPSQPELLDSAVSFMLTMDPTSQIDSLKLRIYREASQNSSSYLIDMLEVSQGIYKSQDAFIYSEKDYFYTSDEDTLAIKFYRGNYFVPQLYTSSGLSTGQFFKLSPHSASEEDISIEGYEIANGKSKVLLLNHADTSSYVVVTLRSKNLNQVFKDTVLTYDDGEEYYEVGTDQINTFYFDFLPLFGKDTMTISIQALDVNDTNQENNSLSIGTDNNYLSYKNASWQNWQQDTCNLESDLFKQLIIDKTFAGSYSIYVKEDSSQNDLSSFGAIQSLSTVLTIQSENEEIGLWGVLNASSLSQENMIAYYNKNDNGFYKVWQESATTDKKFRLAKSGDYLIVNAQDEEAPEIEININAREILERAYVSERSDFSLILKDNYGINPQEEFREILLDGEQISQENMVVIENENKLEMGINFNLEMEPGIHTLQVSAQDLVGNETQSEPYELLYTGESQLINYGNFPNPFTTKTSFIYELTEQFDDVTIKIFTISGQKIYTLSSLLNTTSDLPLHSIGYHEVEWRGKDEFGNMVANGVYFYIIEGQIDGKTIKAKGKIAKLWL